MKKPLQYHSAICFLADVGSVSLAYFGAFFLRFHLQVVPVTKGIPTLGAYLVFLPVALALWIGASAANGLYVQQRKNLYPDEIFAVAKAGSLATLILVALTFFYHYREQSFSRAMLLLFWVLSLTLVSLARVLILHSIRVRHQKGHNLSRAVIVGAGPLGQVVGQKIAELPQLGLRVVGYLDDAPPPPQNGDPPPEVLGGVDMLSRVIEEHGVEEVFVALPRHAPERLEKCLNQLDKEVVNVRVVPDILQFVLLRAGLESLDGIPIINITETPLSGWYAPVKRVADLFFALASLVVLSPLILAIAILVRISSPGPVFYRQERMSLDGTLFTMLKFRSMSIDAEEKTGAVWAQEDDPRRTSLGAFLRRTSLDELPQLINILKGEMSFVGPRPERPVFVEQFRDQVPRYMLRHKVKCGLTGWAQVNGWRGNTSIRKRIEYDIFYIENWSLSFDLKIIWRTLWKGLVNRHAY